jgi:hypothetical protein
MLFFHDCLVFARAMLTANAHERRANGRGIEAAL